MFQDDDNLEDARSFQEDEDFEEVRQAAEENLDEVRELPEDEMMEAVRSSRGLPWDLILKQVWGKLEGWKSLKNSSSLKF